MPRTSPATATNEVSSPDPAKVERAYQHLKEGILSGQYHPNEHLVEAPLTRMLGISRNTLRTVLARLDHEGLIVLEPNRGGRVRAFTLEEAYDIIRVRQVVEGLVARLAAENSTAGQRAQIRAVQTKMEGCFRDNDLIRFTAGSREFHVLIEQAADSSHAMEVLDSLHFPLVKFQFQTILVPGRMEETMNEHEQILRAIENGDADGAEQIARHHISQIAVMLDHLKHLPAVPAAL